MQIEKEKDIVFKKVRFGGFDRVDVMNYIAKITNEFHSYKDGMAKTVNELKNKAVELEKANAELVKKYEELVSSNEEISAQTEIEDKNDDILAAAQEIKRIVESLSENINSFMSSIPVIKTEEEAETEEEHTEIFEETVPREDAEDVAQDVDILNLINKYTE